MQPKSVAVIGAGPSGLVATKELLQEGHDVTCFERTDSVGGVFRYRPGHDAVGVWQSCRLTSSILVTSFSDYFPRSHEGDPYEHRQMLHHEYVDYLEHYAHHFGVLSRIRFGCDVVDMSPLRGARWRVIVRQGDVEEIGEYDAVAVCTGIHRVPYVPELPGQDEFQGQILHSATYKNPNSLRGRSAVFVGAGESSEIVREAADVLDHAYVSLRRGVFVIPRQLRGVPNDYLGTRLMYSLPAVVRRTDTEAQRLQRRIEMALFPFRLPALATSKIRARRRRPPDAAEARSVYVRKLIDRLKAHAGGNQFETFATKTEAFVEAIVDGRCQLRPAIERLTPTGVHFVDGTSVEADTIVLLTGYEKASVPFLSVPLDPDRLYKRCFDPSFGETLAFIGFLRPAVGSIPPMAELQSRWLAGLLSGKIVLPSDEEMRREIEEDFFSRERRQSRVCRRLPHLVDFSSYMDDIAASVGCKPKPSDFLFRPRLLYKIYTSAFCGAQYRFRGPHARPELAAAVFAHAPSHVQPDDIVILALAKAAHLFGFGRFLPHLSLGCQRSLRSRRRRHPQQSSRPMG